MKLGTKVNITTNSFMGSIKGYVGTIVNIYENAEYPYDVIIEEFGLKDCVYPLKEDEFEVILDSSTNLFGPLDVESEDISDDFFSEEYPFKKTHENWDS